MRKTPAASIRWLSLAELKASRLATLALDAARADPRQRRERPQWPRVRRRSAARRSRPGERREAGRRDPPRRSRSRFRYRRGGGAVEAEATERGLKPPRGGRSALALDPHLERARRRAAAVEDQRNDVRRTRSSRASASARSPMAARSWRPRHSPDRESFHRRLSCPPWTARKGLSLKPAPDRAAAPPQARTTPAKP